MKFSTPVNVKPLGVSLSQADDVFMLGSCFADSIGERLACGGFNVMANPFGTLYNPASISNSVQLLDSSRPIESSDCVPLGAGAGLVGSYSFHTSLARPTGAEFLENANAVLDNARAFWRKCNKVVVTLGTSQVWRAKALGGAVVSNCLKRPGTEFERDRLSVEEVSDLLCGIMERHPEKGFIITVSPVRYLSDDPLSASTAKAVLHLAVGNVLSRCGNACYFPAYEIVCDELRDYRFYADDLLHPSKMAVDYIWEKFLNAAVPAREHDAVHAAEAAARLASHRKMH